MEQGQTEKTFSAGDSRSGMVTYYATVGEALGEMYGYKYEGIYTAEDFIEGKDGKLTLREGIVKPKSGTPQPGDIKYAADDVDEEGNPIFTKKNVKIGNGTPDCIGGFNNTFTYKGFDLSVFLKFAIGQDIYNANKQSLTTYSIFENIPQEFSNYYRVVDPSTGKQATLSRMQEMNPDGSARIWGLTKNNKEWGFYPSSYFVEDGSYLRLAQITLGYTLPKTWLKKAMISNARILGWKFSIKTIFAVFTLTSFLPIIQQLTDGVHLLNDQPFMACVIGASFCGGGIGIAFSSNGSTGGTDIIAAIINKYRDITLGRVMLFCDLIIISSSYFVLKDWEKVVYGYVTLYICSFVLDQVVNSARQSVQFFIISEKYEEIARHINVYPHRGATVINASGFYTGKEIKMLFVLAKKRESTIIFRLIKDIDPNAFVSQSQVIGVYGEGFDKIKVK